MKDNYIVAHITTPKDAPVTFVKVAGDFESTRDSLKWVKNFGGDGIAYAVMKVTKVVEVETVSNKRIRDRSHER